MAALSPPGSALAAGSSGALVTASGTFTWARNTVAFNGVVVTSSAATKLVIDASGNVWVLSGGFWWPWTGTAWGAATATTPTMPAAPVTPTTGAVFNITGDVTINATGNVTVNGTVANTGTTTGGGTVTPPTNPILQMPAGIAIAAPVTLGTGPDQIVLGGACNPGAGFASNGFSLVGVFGTAQAALTGALECTSQTGIGAGEQVFTINADLAGMTGLIVQTVAGQMNLMFTNSLQVNGIGWLTDTDAPTVNSRSTGTPLYATSLFDSGGGSALWLPPSAIPVVVPPPPPATQTTISGATGSPVTSGTLAAIVAGVSAGGTLTLPAGIIVATAKMSVQMTLAGAGPGVTILDAANLPLDETKAILVLGAGGVVVEKLTLRNAAISAANGNNGAGARDDGPGLTPFIFNNVEFTGDQDGILSNGGSWTLTGCYTHDNGAGNGLTHEMYFNDDTANVVTLNQHISTCGLLSTHALKSRACTTVLNGGTFTGSPDPTGNVAGSVVDIPNGGDFTAIGTTFVLAPGTSNMVFYGYKMETIATNPGIASVFTNAIFNGNGVAGEIQCNAANSPTATLDVTGSTYLGAAGPPVISGFASVTGTITAAPAA